MFVVSIIILVIASLITARLTTVLNVTESAYSDLLSKFNVISGQYDILLSINDRLTKERDNLTKILERYTWLDLPLENKSVPSINELKLWLQIDKTDELKYDDPDFTCFQFSVVLMLHGRAQHYDIGVIAIYGYNNKTGEPFSHSINAIITTEGLVYIEPQVGEVWWLEDHSQITNGTVQVFPMFEDPIHIVEVFIFFDYR